MKQFEKYEKPHPTSLLVFITLNSTRKCNSNGFFFQCLGNHEFDDGVDNLIQFLEKVESPVVCANLNLSMEPRLKNVTNLQPSIKLNVGGKKIGIIGYLTPDTMVSMS